MIYSRHYIILAKALDASTLAKVELSNGSSGLVQLKNSGELLLGEGCMYRFHELSQS